MKRNLSTTHGKPSKQDNSNSPKQASPSSRPLPQIDVSRVKRYTDSGQTLVLNAMKATLALPSGNSRDLYATHPSFVRIMDAHANKILHAISDVLRMHEVKGNIVTRDREEKFEILQEFNDTMLERINSNLDEITGVKKKHETVLVHSEIRLPAEPRYRLSGTWNNNSNTTSAPAVKATLITGTNIQRPQSNFKVPVDNSALNPFVPKIKDKPNSLKPLAVLPEYDDAGNIVSYLHPYEFELDRFQPSKEALKPVKPHEPLAFESTPYDFIDKEHQIPALLKELKQTKELAIDLEHHSYRTFQGITCLMQISTRSKDYIIDTLSLREELYVLNQVFTNPNVVKVLHGSISDIEWLQRDLALYIVNMFDTAEAAKVLEFSRVGLQFLLKHYCNIETDKAYQLADWRIRPIPENFIEYARKDTHYLLYIYDCMRNNLIEKGPSFLLTVYNKSTFLCKRRYQKTVINEDAIMNIYRRSKHVFDQRQMYAFREILFWRDKIARQEDESAGYVLPQHMALDIASKLPREMQGIIACCTPVPSLVRQHLHTLHQIILKAREIPLNKAVPQAIEQQKDTRHKIQSTFDINNPLFCPHDNSQGGHLETNLPTLLDSPSKIRVCEEIVKGLVKDLPDAGVFAESKTRTLDEKGRLILTEMITEDPRMIKFIEKHYAKKPSDGSQDFNESFNVSYQDRKFNTPYERHLETCRNRYQNESEPEESPPTIKQEPEQSGSSTYTPPASVKKESAMGKAKSLPLKTLKRKEDNEAKRKLVQTESVDKIKFNDYEPPSKKEKFDRRSKGEYPLQIQPFADTHNESDAEEDVRGDEDAARESNRKSFMGDRKGKNNKKKFKKPGKANGKQFRQSSNKPVAFDYSKVDFSRFQGGSRPIPQKGKPGKFVLRKPDPEEDGSNGEGSSNTTAMMKNLHPNSRIAKGIKKNEKMFNFSTSNLKKK